VLIIAGAVIFMGKGANTEQTNTAAANNVTMEDGKQIVVINAKGGYLPRTSSAKAGIPTILRFDTNGTFDCSSSVRIPSLNISKVLPQNGTTDIDIGNPQTATLQGVCGMGMYRFEVDFRS
jgi:plastocyanin domain-containing protein